MDDVARFMIEGLERGDLIGRRFTIGGPERLCIEDVLKILSDVIGQHITLEYLPGRQFGEYIYDRLGSALGPDKMAFANFFDSFYTFNNYSPQRPFEVNVDALLKIIPIRGSHRCVNGCSSRIGERVQLENGLGPLLGDRQRNCSIHDVSGGSRLSTLPAGYPIALKRVAKPEATF
jgi:hypothetical protein